MMQTRAEHMLNTSKFNVFMCSGKTLINEDFHLSHPILSSNITDGFRALRALNPRQAGLTAGRFGRTTD